MQQIIFFIRGAIGAEDADGAARITDGTQTIGGDGERLLPSGCLQRARRVAHQRLAQAIGMVGKVKGVAALDAEKVLIDAAFVAVVAA